MGLRIGSIHSWSDLCWQFISNFQAKKNKDWRMCVDYTDLNKVCKKDLFDLLHVDQVMNSMT
jgi:hypothetical protein